MIIKKQAILLLVTFVTCGVIFFATTEQSNAGFATIGDSCCQMEGSCFDFGDQNPDEPTPACLVDDIIDNATCNEQTGLCTQISAISPVPTLSEWGLVAMAAILGIAGYIVVRRRRVNA
jgi:hypothetical protein